jgi:PAS domain S-box-containing protein
MVQAKQKLRKSYSGYLDPTDVSPARSLVHFASDAAFAVDGELKVVAWNARAQELLGYQAEEVLGRPCYVVLRGILPDGQPLCTPECQAKHCFCCYRPFMVQSCLVPRKDGSWIKLSLGSLVLPQSTPQNEGIAAVVFLRPLEAEVATVGGLRVFTLGCFCLAVADRGIPVVRWSRKQALLVLKYLITHRGRPVHRERLIECLWPGVPEPQGRERLKVTVYFLRRQLREAGVEDELIETAEEAYRLRPEAFWLDADVFEKRVRQAEALEAAGNPEGALQHYQDAEALYQGDYLEEERYSDWCAEERERLRELYLEMLLCMANLYAAQGEYGKAAQVCRKALVREPCRESFHRALMDYLWRQGRRDEALAQFERCRTLLARELEVPPMPDTEQLYREILHSTPP